MDHTIVAYGEALWDILPSGSVLGGAPLNFAYRADALGNTVFMVSKLGEDELGEKALSLIQELGMDTTYIQRDNAYPTGTVNVFFDENRNPDYTINEGVAYDHITRTDALTELAGKADCLCFGSLIQREEESRRTLYSLLETFGGTYKLFDINVRKNCYSRETIETSLEYADILKLNEEEIAYLDELFNFGESTIAGRSSRILTEFGLTYCLVTMGDKGSFAVSDKGEKIYGPGYKVELIDPVGSGDACTAGFIHKLLVGTSLEEAVRFGNGYGALVAGQEGATKPISKQQIEEFIRTNPYSGYYDEFK
jgi:fructokinase